MLVHVSSLLPMRYKTVVDPHRAKGAPKNLAYQFWSFLQSPCRNAPGGIPAVRFKSREVVWLLMLCDLLHSMGIKI